MPVIWDNEESQQAPTNGVVWDTAPAVAPTTSAVVWDAPPAAPAAAPTSFLGGMATEAQRLLTLPGRTFMEGMQSGAGQWQKALEGEPIDVFGYKIPAAVSAPLRVVGGLLEGVNAPITAATRMVTDPATRLLQSATGISEPTRETIQGMGDVALGVFGPAGIAKLREVPGAFKPAPPIRGRAVEPSTESVVWDDAGAVPVSATRAAAAPARFERTALGDQAVMEGLPERAMPTTATRATAPQAAIEDTALFGQERAASEAAMARSQAVIWDDAPAMAPPAPRPAPFQAKGDWATGVPDLANPDDVFAVVQGAGKIKVGEDLAGELRGVPAMFKSKNGRSIDDIAAGLIEDYPHLGNGDRGVVKEQLLDTMTSYATLKSDVRAAEAVPGQAGARKVLGFTTDDWSIMSPSSRAEAAKRAISDAQEEVASAFDTFRTARGMVESPGAHGIPESALPLAMKEVAEYESLYRQSIDRVAKLFGPDVMGAMQAAVEQGGRINPQTLSSLAGSLVGGLGGAASGDTTQERIALGLTGAMLGGLAGRQAGKLFTRGAGPVARAADEVAPVAAEVPPAPRPFAALESAIGVPLTETRVATPITGAIANAADAAVAPRIATGPTQRLFRHVHDALAAGEIAPESLPGILERHGISATDFARDYAQAVSDSGRTLGQLSQLRQRLGVVFANEPEAARALAALPEAPVSGFAKAMDVYRKVDDQRRALLVSQWATSARNAITQTARLGLDSVDNALSAAIGGESAVGSLQAGLDNFAAVARRMTPAGRERLAGIMAEFPLDAARLAGTISGEATLGSKLSSFINPMNAAQEGFFRKVAFDAKLSTLARERGLNMDQLAASPGQIPGDLIQHAAKHALEVTFASTPAPGSFGHALLNAYRELPILTTINPFPRFFGNALKFLYEFSPLGITKLLTPAAERTLASGNPATAAQVMSRAALGTGMLAGAMAIRGSELGGEKWYELKVPGSDQRLDTRAFGPFNMYLLFAEGMIHPERLTVADWAKGLVGINRVAGTGLVVTDALTSGSLDQKLQRFYSFVGEYLGGFSVPARNFKSMIEGGLSGSPDVAAQESLLRDKRDDPLTAPFLSNLPGVSQSLPAMVSSTSSAPIRNEAPLMRGLLGASTRTKNEAQQLIDTLGLESNQVQPTSGIPAWDRALAEPLGPVVEQLLPAISHAPNFAALPPEIQRYIVRQGLSEARKGVRDIAVGAHPDLAEQATLKGLDPDLRGYMGITRQGVRQAPGGPMDALRRLLGSAVGR